jgi:hypothetical protein
VAFDLIELNSVDLRSQPIEVRRAKLAKLLGEPSDGLMFSQSFEGDGPIVHRHACALGLEGIISKLRGVSLSFRTRSGLAENALRGLSAKVRRTDPPHERHKNRHRCNTGVREHNVNLGAILFSTMLIKSSI